MDEVYPRLYMSGWEANANREHMIKMGITHVVQCTGVKSNNHTDLIKYMKIDVEDSQTENLLPYFVLTNEFIEEALTSNSKNKVLVHCAAGVSRSGAVCIAYMLVSEPTWDFEKAWTEGRKKRP
jgi:protein-tyrosine phosphatase